MIAVGIWGILSAFSSPSMCATFRLASLLGSLALRFQFVPFAFKSCQAVKVRGLSVTDNDTIWTKNVPDWSLWWWQLLKEIRCFHSVHGVDPLSRIIRQQSFCKIQCSRREPSTSCESASELSR